MAQAKHFEEYRHDGPGLRIRPLVAFASAVRRRAAEQGAKQKQLEKIHRAFVERGVVGLDINRAAQCAAGQLTMGGLGANFRNIRLWTLPRGRRDGWAKRAIQGASRRRDARLVGAAVQHENSGEASDFEKDMANPPNPTATGIAAARKWQILWPRTPP